MIQTLEDLCLELNKNSGEGFLMQVPEDVYRAHPYVSQSELKQFARYTPAHYREHRMNPPESSNSMKLGTAAHTAILEPLRFDEIYFKGPDVDLRTKKGKEELAAAEDQAFSQGKTVLKPEIFTAVLQMRDNIRKSPYFSSYLSGGVIERSLFGQLWKAEKKSSSPVYGKGRLDYFKPDTHEIVDLKSTESAAAEHFEHDIRRYKYHWQAVFYSDLVESLSGITPNFVILAVEKKPSYAAQLHEIGFDLMAIARLEIREALKSFSHCLSTDQWPAYPERINPVRAKEWEWKSYKDTIRAQNGT